jgi:hypothetical protein
MLIDEAAHQVLHHALGRQPVVVGKRDREGRDDAQQSNGKRRQSQLTTIDMHCFLRFLFWPRDWRLVVENTMSAGADCRPTVDAKLP